MQKDDVFSNAKSAPAAASPNTQQSFTDDSSAVANMNHAFTDFRPTLEPSQPDSVREDKAIKIYPKLGSATLGRPIGSGKSLYRLDNLARAHKQDVNGQFQLPECLLDPDMHRLASIACPFRPATTAHFLISKHEAITKKVRERCFSQEAPASLRGDGHDSGYASEVDDAAARHACAPIGSKTSLSDEVTWKIDAMQTHAPPVTIDNLKELELPAIQNTLSLRIDLCFDHDLFFQRISGLKGEEKRIRAQIYYQCLALELKAIGHALHGSCPECLNKQRTGFFSMPSRLSSFFRALRDLLGLLVPDNEKEEVVGKVDVDLLTKQVRVGLFDAEAFSTWLCNLITSHCAPMRDEMAQEMREKVVDGTRNNDMDLLVEGLEVLLNLLENMKIDVANHQVRSFKLLLIADTVPFLRDCFTKMIGNQQFDASSSKQWFAHVCKLENFQDKPVFDRFVFGLVQLCCRSSDSYPSTFNYDKDRLQLLRNDVCDLVHLEICLKTFRELYRAQQGKAPSRAAVQTLSERLIQLSTSEDGINEGIEPHRKNIALELARASLGAGSTSARISPSDLAKMKVSEADEHLKRNLRQLYDSQLTDVVHRLNKCTLHHAHRLAKLPDTLAISNNQRAWSIQRSETGLSTTPDIEDISRRLAHIAVIHWQVWSDLVYLGEPTGHENDLSSFSDPGSWFDMAGPSGE